MARQYEWEKIFEQAAQVAAQCGSVSELAQRLNIPSRTFRDAMKRHDISFADFLLGGVQGQQATIEKLKQQNRYLGKEIEHLREILGQKEWLLDAVKQAAAAIKPERVDPPLERPQAETPQTAVLMLSDIHLGQKTVAEELGVFGEYNSDLAIARMCHTFTTFANVAKHQPFPVEKMIVAALGDLVEHAQLRPGHEGFVDLDVTKQTLTVAQILSEGLSMLASEFPTIELIGVPGNHGRVAADPRKNHPAENFDYLAYKIAEIALKDQENVAFQIPESWYAHFSIYDWNFFAIHGENTSRAVAE